MRLARSPDPHTLFSNSGSVIPAGEASLPLHSSRARLLCLCSSTDHKAFPNLHRGEWIQRRSTPTRDRREGHIIFNLKHDDIPVNSGKSYYVSSVEYQGLYPSLIPWGKKGKVGETFPSFPGKEREREYTSIPFLSPWTEFSE